MNVVVHLQDKTKEEKKKKTENKTRLNICSELRMCEGKMFNGERTK